MRSYVTTRRDSDHRVVIWVWTACGRNRHRCQVKKRWDAGKRDGGNLEYRDVHIGVMLDLITVGVARLEELQFAESSHALEVKRTDALRHTGSSTVWHALA